MGGLLIFYALEMDIGRICEQGKKEPPRDSAAACDLPGGSKRAAEQMRPGQALVGDRGFDTSGMVGGLRELGIRPHIRAKSSRSALDRRTTSKAAYKESLTRLFIVEGAFGWLKQEGRMSQAKVRGREKVDSMFILNCCA